MQTQFVIDEDSTELLYDYDDEPYHSVSVFIQKTPFEKFTDDAINFLIHDIACYAHNIKAEIDSSLYSSTIDAVFVRIKNEICNIFTSIQLSDTQLAIFNSLSLDELKILSENVAGELYQGGRALLFSYFYNGQIKFDETGVDFRCLRKAVEKISNEILKEFNSVDSLVDNINAVNEKIIQCYNKENAALRKHGLTPSGLCKIYIDFIGHTAITQYLDLVRFENSFEERKKSILSVFYSELMKFASPHQVECIYNEMNKKIHQPLIKMQQPQYFGFMFDAQGYEKTENAIRYFNTVLALHISCSRYCLLIWPMLFQHEIPKTHRYNLNNDLGKHIFGFFNGSETRKFINGFPLVNREIAAACAKEHSEFKSLRR